MSDREAHDREAHLVELVAPDGRPVGAATVAEAHRPPGRAHRAFSVMLADPDGRVLLQRRAATKTRFALRWANACCGHPAPGQAVREAGSRRLAEELGLTGIPLAEVGVYPYRAEDPVAGRVEHEFDHVLHGGVAAAHVDLALDPHEVAEVRWVAAEQLRAELCARPDDFAPWLGGVLAVWSAAVA